MGFLEPLFLARGATVVRMSAVGGNKHARFRLRQGGSIAEGIFFNTEPEFLELQQGSALDIVFHLQVNEWNGTAKPEICIRDWRTAA